MLSDGIRHVPKSTTPPGLRSGLPVVLITGDDTGEKDPPPAASDATVCCTGSDGEGEKSIVGDSLSTSIMVNTLVTLPSDDVPPDRVVDGTKATTSGGSLMMLYRFAISNARCNLAFSISSLSSPSSTLSLWIRFAVVVDVMSITADV